MEELKNNDFLNSNEEKMNGKLNQVVGLLYDEIGKMRDYREALSRQLHQTVKAEMFEMNQTMKTVIYKAIENCRYPALDESLQAFNKATQELKEKVNAPLKEKEDKTKALGIMGILLIAFLFIGSFFSHSSSHSSDQTRLSTPKLMPLTEKPAKDEEKYIPPWERFNQSSKK